MAVNQIVFGGQTVVDLTSDTVTEDKVLSGYTFHKANGQQATGTASSGTDTSDATASASDILTGKTAYANGSKLTGTCAFNADTSSDTAIASDVAQGKTFHLANGQQAVGTATGGGSDWTDVTNLIEYSGDGVLAADSFAISNGTYVCMRYHIVNESDETFIELTIDESIAPNFSEIGGLEIGTYDAYGGTLIGTLQLFDSSVQDTIFTDEFIFIQIYKI